jgi:hypothetical protein
MMTLLHMALSVQKSVMKNGTPVVPQPPYRLSCLYQTFSISQKLVVKKDANLNKQKKYSYKKN